MTTFGRALEMHVRLGRLIREHRVENDPVVIPLSPPVDHPLIFEGRAATVDIDLERTKFGPHCFMPFKKKLPPLLFRHDPNQPAGHIEELRSDDDGLFIRCRVDHPEALRCSAFSICGTIHSYSMRRADSSDFFALVTCCTVDEISITDRPCNPRALVRHRYRPSAHDGLYDAIGEKVRLLVQLTNTMKEQQAHVRVQPSR